MIRAIRWASLLAVFALTSTLEYEAGIAAGLDEWQACALPVAVDGYALFAWLSGRDLWPALIAMEASVVVGAAHAHLEDPGTFWLAVGVGTMLTAVAFRINRLFHDDLDAAGAAARAEAAREAVVAELRAAAAAAAQDAREHAEALARARAEHASELERIRAEAAVPVQPMAPPPAHDVAQRAARDRHATGTRSGTPTGTVRGTGTGTLAAQPLEDQVAWFRAQLRDHPDRSYSDWSAASGLPITTVRRRLDKARELQAVAG